MVVFVIASRPQNGPLRGILFTDLFLPVSDTLSYVC